MSPLVSRYTLNAAALFWFRRVWDSARRSEGLAIYFLVATSALFLMLSILPMEAVAADVLPDKLPWPPSKHDRREIGEALRGVLTRSNIPEAEELLTALPSNDSLFGYERITQSRLYFGEWRLSEDGRTLLAIRVRNELIRHHYKVHFTWIDGRWVGSDLEVTTFHGIPKSALIE